MVDLADIDGSDSIHENVVNGEDELQGKLTEDGGNGEDTYAHEEDELHEPTFEGTDSDINDTQRRLMSVPKYIKPFKYQVFSSYDDVVAFYKRYAAHVGFEVRLGTIKTNNKDGSIRLRWLVCHRYGKPVKRSYNSLEGNEMPIEKRNSNFKVTDCKASLTFRIKKGTSLWEIYGFCEQHNHSLIDVVDKNFSRGGRQLGVHDHEFMHRLTFSNIGPISVHNMQVALNGGYDNVGPSNVDYKNFHRDVRCYVGDADCQTVIDKLNSRKSFDPEFALEYIVDKDELMGLFWADGLARYNYKQFGDVIYFDGTYRTNMYAMIFVPFTAVDNHSNSIVVGAALIGNETFGSYKWLLESFLKVHGRQPTIVLTDQDCSMKDAISQVFPDSRHHLCMWHIMNKVPGKICGDLEDNTEFRRRLSKLVWNINLDSHQFETQWQALVDEYNLTHNRWLLKSFENRMRRIPAYFSDVHMCGLMKTTSRSESTNSYFGGFSNANNNLVQFMYTFDAAMDKQRFEQRKEEFNSSMSTPLFKTDTFLERHAARMFTRTIFFDVQNEIFKAVKYCFQWTIALESRKHIFTIKEKDESYNFKVEFKVVHNETEHSFECSCHHYHFYGCHCCHVYTLLHNLGYRETPQKYVHRRWCKDVIPRDVLRSLNPHGEAVDEAEKGSQEVLADIIHCINVLKLDKQGFASFQRDIRSLRDKVDSNLPKQLHNRKNPEVISNLLGVSHPENIKIHPPKGIQNKGCGTGKRLVGPGEKAKNGRTKRFCRICRKPYHDSRNCDQKNKNKGDASSEND